RTCNLCGCFGASGWAWLLLFGNKCHCSVPHRFTPPRLAHPALTTFSFTAETQLGRGKNKTEPWANFWLNKQRMLPLPSSSTHDRHPLPMDFPTLKYTRNESI